MSGVALREFAALVDRHERRAVVSMFVRIALVTAMLVGVAACSDSSKPPAAAASSASSSTASA